MRQINWKYEIGQIIKDNKRNLIITNNEIRVINNKNGKKHNEKWYKYTCNVCGWTEGWILESNLLKGTGCSCCASRTVVEGINDIPTIAPWMIPYFQGGYDEAKLYTCCSHSKIYPICPDCGRVNNKQIKIDNIYNGHISCSCSDKISYPEKFIFSLLKELKITFKTQLSRKILKWCKDYRYDFYFKWNGEEIIIETHGRQHYDESGGVFEKTLKEEQENDRIKKELALHNGIKPENYIVIDCRKSEPNWIKQNIYKSNLKELFELSKIDWNSCSKFACSNLVKTTCEYKRNNPDLTCDEIGKIMDFDAQTIRKWLKQGDGIWCHYNVKEESFKGRSKSGKMNGKPIIIFRDNIFKGLFYSCMELSRRSENVFGVKLSREGVSDACNNKRLHYKGFLFKYIEDLTSEEYIKYEIENKLKELYSQEN